MATIQKPKPAPHIIIPDTSTLWFEDKQYPVDPNFDTFLSEYSHDFALEVKIPDVVRGELLFQQTTSALKGLKRANDEILKVSKITQKKYKHRVTEDRIRREVEAKLDTWFKRFHWEVLPTPTNTINWPTVIKQAIWRIPPFSYNPKDKNDEKGFRDALILETLVHFVSQESRDIQFAFLCKDQLLRESTESRLKSDTRFSAFELIEDFRTYLDLTKEKLEDKFIKTIISRASQKFFTKGDKSCLYYSADIRSSLLKKYESYFNNPERSEEGNNRRYSLLRRVRGNRWESLDSGMFWIGRTQYSNREDNNIYIWHNEINFIQQYIQEPEASNKNSIHRILHLTFKINWKSKVASDGRFISFDLISDDLTSNKFIIPTEDDVKKWKLEEY